MSVCLPIVAPWRRMGLKVENPAPAVKTCSSTETRCKRLQQSVPSAPRQATSFASKLPAGEVGGVNLNRNKASGVSVHANVKNLHWGEKPKKGQAIQLVQERPQNRCSSLLLEPFLHHGQLQLCFRQRFENHCFRQLCRCIPRRRHLADKQILGAFQHFLFAEGKGFASAEGAQTL